LLETVRQYGRDLLHESGESESIRNSHLNYFLAMAEDAEPKLKGREQMQTMALLEDEHENLRAALEWSLQGSGTEEAMRLCSALILFWWRQGHLQEGKDWCLRAADSTFGQRKTSFRSRALNGAGMLSCFQGDSVAAQGYYRESYDLILQSEDRQHLSETLCGLGFAAFFLDDYESSRKYVRESYEVAKEVGDIWYEAWTGYFLGILTRIEGDYEAAIKRYEEAIAIYRKMGDRIGLSYPVYDVGLAEFYRGNLTAAQKYLEESLSIRRDTGDLWGTAESEFGLGLVALAQRDYRLAAQRLEKAKKVGEEIGDKTRIAIVLHYLARVALAEGDPLAGRRLNDDSLAIYAPLEDRWGLSHCFAGYASLAADSGELLDAVRLWALSARLREEIGSPLPPYERTIRDQELASVRAKMGDDRVFESAWADGSALTIDQALATISPA